MYINPPIIALTYSQIVNLKGVFGEVSETEMAEFVTGSYDDLDPQAVESSILVLKKFH